MPGSGKRLASGNLDGPGILEVEIDLPYALQLLALHQQACIEQKHPAAALAVRDFWDVSAASTSRAPTVPSRRPLPATRASVPPDPAFEEV